MNYGNKKRFFWVHKNGCYWPYWALLPFLTLYKRNRAERHRRNKSVKKRFKENKSCPKTTHRFRKAAAWTGRIPNIFVREPRFPNKFCSGGHSSRAGVHAAAQDRGRLQLLARRRAGVGRRRPAVEGGALLPEPQPCSRLAVLARAVRVSDGDARFDAQEQGSHAQASPVQGLLRLV